MYCPWAQLVPWLGPAFKLPMASNSLGIVAKTIQDHKLIRLVLSIIFVFLLHRDHDAEQRPADLHHRMRLYCVHQGEFRWTLTPRNLIFIIGQPRATRTTEDVSFIDLINAWWCEMWISEIDGPRSFHEGSSWRWFVLHVHWITIDIQVLSQRYHIRFNWKCICRILLRRLNLWSSTSFPLGFSGAVISLFYIFSGHYTTLAWLAFLLQTWTTIVQLAAPLFIKPIILSSPDSLTACLPSGLNAWPLDRSGRISQTDPLPLCYLIKPQLNWKAPWLRGRTLDLGRRGCSLMVNLVLLLLLMY